MFLHSFLPFLFYFFCSFYLFVFLPFSKCSLLLCVFLAVFCGVTEDGTGVLCVFRFSPCFNFNINIVEVEFEVEVQVDIEKWHEGS